VCVMPANVLIDRAPTQQPNGQHHHAAANSSAASTDSMTAAAADVFCTGAGDLDAAVAAVSNAAAIQFHSGGGARPSSGFQAPTAAHQLAIDLAKLASNLNMGGAVTEASCNGAAAMSSSSSSAGGNASSSPVLSRAGVVSTTAGGGVVANGILSDMSAAAVAAGGGRKSANMTECVPVPSSEHVAEIVGRQGT